MTARPLLVVDGANVVGSVPDGWWRDRRGAAERLRDALVPVAGDGLPPESGAPDRFVGVALEVVLVVEGAARGVAPLLPAVRVAATAGSGDDLIVDLAARARAADADRPILVVTADRELRRRVGAVGASSIGPRAVPRG
ncbi:NTP pyrophosphohydrolase [Streptomyces sp. NBC_01190]|uniref:NTP pyrophosphohydrolase n=1 Tax=Streptomyces sp. NBC_01190 TaxID=2903767 RepID=UPI003866BBBF|nr:NTP pyrophosphohydrolase [Streptomyces sp. NBC_01190]